MRYNGVTFMVTKRMSHNWQGVVSLVLSKAEGRLGIERQIRPPQNSPEQPGADASAATRRSERLRQLRRPAHRRSSRRRQGAADLPVPVGHHGGGQPPAPDRPLLFPRRPRQRSRASRRRRRSTWSRTRATGASRTSTSSMRACRRSSRFRTAAMRFDVFARRAEPDQQRSVRDRSARCSARRRPSARPPGTSPRAGCSLARRSAGKGGEDHENSTNGARDRVDLRPVHLGLCRGSGGEYCQSRSAGGNSNAERAAVPRRSPTSAPACLSAG